MKHILMRIVGTDAITVPYIKSLFRRLFFNVIIRYNCFETVTFVRNRACFSNLQIKKYFTLYAPFICTTINVTLLKFCFCKTNS